MARSLQHPRSSRRFGLPLAVGVLAILMAVLAPAATLAADPPSLTGGTTPEERLVDALGGDPSTPADARRFAHVDKLDSHLQSIGADARLNRDVERSAAREGIEATGDLVPVDVYVRGSIAEAARELRALGMDVGATSGRSTLDVVEGRIDADALAAVARLATVRAVIPVLPPHTDADDDGPFPITDAGSQLAQSDAGHRGPQARALDGSASNVEVGIISDSIDRVGNGVEDSQASGDLPPGARVTTLLDGPADSSDEGRAMAEIVYDSVPSVGRILFSTGVEGAVAKAAAIDNLVANGADVIADDIRYLMEPMFQDGVISQAIDRAKGNGTPYFISAGNQSRQSDEGTFKPVPASGFDGNDFDPGPGVDQTQTLVTVPNGRGLGLSLQWDEPWGASTTNLVAGLRAAGAPEDEYLAVGLSDNGFPVQYLEWNNTTGSAKTIELVIQRPVNSGTRAPLFKWIAAANFGPFTAAEYSDTVDAINPDASARGAFAAAAIDHADPGLDDPESFSSRGVPRRLFDVNGNRLPAPEVRQKPDGAGIDNVATSVPGFAAFRGTSAAAPALAAVAALTEGADAGLTVDDVYAIMKRPENTTDCTAPGEPDPDCGYGLPFADRTVAMAQDSSPPTVTPSVDPPSPDGANGWYRGNVTVTWSAADPDSPVTSAPCPPVTITTDFDGPVSCAAHSAGGDSTQSVTIRRDATRPARPALGRATPGATGNSPRVTGAAENGTVVRLYATPDCSGTPVGTDTAAALASPGVPATLPGGATTSLRATATDEAGNVSDCSNPIVVSPFAATNGDDILNGTDAGEIICGLFGNDAIKGLAGNDRLFGDACNKPAKQTPADGNDTLNGGGGNDTLYGAGGRDTLKGGKGKDKLFGGKGKDKLLGGGGVNTYKGGDGNDTVMARNGKKETVDCGAGKDDRATVDKFDTVKGCEKVERPK